MSRIAVAVSGGADSLYAMVLLKEQGHDVLAVHGRFLPDAEAPDALPGLRQLCALLDIPLHILDFRDLFEKEVVRPFIAAYAAGDTPNPCARCNAHIKFGALLQAAWDLGAQKLATGHYARRICHPVYGDVLGRSADQRKDQSYFLSLVPAASLRRTLFPLAQCAKTAVLDTLRQRGLPTPLPRESQEICFVPADYRDFLLQRSAALGIALPPGGPMRLADGRTVGRHQGLWRYTEGQRHGLGVAWSEPLYVTGKDGKHNALLLGTRNAPGMKGCRTEKANLLIPPECWPQQLLVRVRYRQHSVPAAVALRDGCLEMQFTHSQLPSAPGQIATVYDADGIVLAGGILREIYR